MIDISNVKVQMLKPNVISEYLYISTYATCHSGDPPAGGDTRI